MLAVEYTILDGEIIAEATPTSHHDYLLDPLGSVIAKIDSLQTITEPREFWPYGQLASGTAPAIGALTFVGSQGYMVDHAGFYVRMRTYADNLGAWRSKDLLWPDEMAYEYSYSDPVGETDFTGLSPCAYICAPCLACLIDLVIVCPPGPDFFECAAGVIEHLPPWAKWLCGGGCAACLACIGYRAAPRVGAQAAKVLPKLGRPKPLPGPGKSLPNIPPRPIRWPRPRPIRWPKSLPPGNKPTPWYSRPINWIKSLCSRISCDVLAQAICASLEIMANLFNWKYWIGYDNCRSLLFELCTRKRMGRA